MNKKYLVLAILVCVIGLAVIVLPGHAQDPEPTPSATPPTQYGLALSSGQTLVVERSISFGDIGVIIALGVLTIINLVLGLVNLVHSWLR